MRALAFTIPIAIATGLLLSCAHAPAPPSARDHHGRPGDGRGPVIRVALATSANGITVGGNGTWHLAVDGQREAPLPLGPSETRHLELAPGRGVRVAGAGEEKILLGDVLAYPDSPSTFMLIEGRPYRGYLVITAGAEGLDLVNRLRLEDYLRSVVPGEIGRGSAETLEALKSQAVASRTYAYRKCEEREKQAFDVQAGILDQVYSGAAGESPAADRACRETVGEIICVNGRPVEALYSSTCGGRSADPNEVWGGGTNATHLVSRPDRGRDGDFCARSKHHRWEVTWDGGRFLSIFATYYPRLYPSQGRPPGQLRDVKIVERGPSGRVTVLEVVTTSGRHRIERDAIRWILRKPDESPLPSTSFEVHIERRGDGVKTITVRGRGSGHGVGMCQTGAIGMSAQGYRYPEILDHYYRGTKLRRAY